MSIINLPTSSSSGLPNVNNFTPSTTLAKWRKALAGVKSGQGNATILCLGDSTTMGVGTGSSTTSGQFYQNSFPKFLSDRFNNAGVASSWQSVISSGNTSNATPSSGNNDSRFVKGSSWSAAGSTHSIGGTTFTASTNTNALSFTPNFPVDTFVVFYQGNTANGSFTIDVNGGAATTVNSTTGSKSYLSSTITAPLGLNTCNVKWLSGGGVNVWGILAYDSSKPQVIIANAGWAGMTSARFVDADVLLTMPSLGQQLTIINCGINDWDNGPAISVATHLTNMQSAITKCLTVGDVVLMTPNPSQVGSSGVPPRATQLQYIAAQYQLAKTNNLTLIDNYGRLVSWEAANPLGFYFDNLHSNAYGYADQSDFIYNVLGAP